MAVKDRSAAVVEEMLLVDGTILNERDKKGNTAVHIATRKWRPQVHSFSALPFLCKFFIIGKIRNKKTQIQGNT